MFGIEQRRNAQLIADIANHYMNLRTITPEVDVVPSDELDGPDCITFTSRAAVPNPENNGSLIEFVAADILPDDPTIATIGHVASIYSAGLSAAIDIPVDAASGYVLPNQLRRELAPSEIRQAAHLFGLLDAYIGHEGLNR